MLIDKTLDLGTAAIATATSGTTYGSVEYNFGYTPVDIGPGEPLDLVITFTTLPTSGTGGFTVKLFSAATASATGVVAATILYIRTSVPTDRVVSLRIPNLLQYVRFGVVRDGTASTGVGLVECSIQRASDAQTNTTGITTH